MTPAIARGRLDAIAATWRRGQIGLLILRTAAFAVPLVTLAAVSVADSGARPWAMLAALVLAVLLAWAPPRLRWADSGLVARHLDRHLPALEESTTLLLRDDADLAPVERLQRDRLLPVIDAIDSSDAIPSSLLRRPLGEVGAGLLAALLVAGLAVLTTNEGTTGATTADRRAVAPPTPLDGVEILVEPPAYSGLEPRRQKDLEVTAVEGSDITWSVPASSTGRPLRVEMLTGAGEVRTFTDVGGEATLSIPAADPTVYRLAAHLDGAMVQETGFTRLDVLPDEAPRLAVVAPAERLTLIPADTEAIELEVLAADDYGLVGAELVATLALGAGEMVEFRERRLPLATAEGSRETTLRHRFDLTGLELGPAAELYFHVEARDNRAPEPNIGRSPTTIVRVEGEVTATADLGEGLPIILPPTYFRSQRQIIIDTEKLIDEAPRLEEPAVRQRSEALAADQRALRMRYGALLGEEFVSGRAVGAAEGETGTDDHEEHVVEEGEDAMAEALEALGEGMFHQHDSAEAATYFATETRAQLKAVLAEMWDAEGRLRVIDPEGALPYENRALVLLKELQQASRIYVRKVGFDAPPLEPEARRLTGELDEIRTRYETLTPPPPSEVDLAARHLLARLDSLEAESPTDLAITAEPLLGPVARLATRRPEAAEALGALTGLGNGTLPGPEALRNLEATLWALLPRPAPAPALPAATTDPLSRRYRELRSDGGRP